MITHRTLISGLMSLVTVCGLCPLAASAAGELVQSWRTDDGWLTELRVHPNGAKVCSTGKAAYTPHSSASPSSVAVRRTWSCWWTNSNRLPTRVVVR